MTYSVPQEILDANHQVFSLRIRGRTVFVKKRRRSKNPLGRFAQQALYRLSGSFLVLPTAVPENSVIHESDKIRRLGSLGLPVPEILHVDENYFVMTDTGRSLQKVLKGRRSQAGDYAERAAVLLRRLHDQGEIHGGPQIKNLTLKDDILHFIDLEEMIPEGNPEQYRLRDFFLLVLSLERHRHNPDLPALCRVYGGDRGDAVLADMCSALRALRILRVLDADLFKRLSMRDVRSLTGLIRKAEAAIPRGITASAPARPS